MQRAPVRAAKAAKYIVSLAEVIVGSANLARTRQRRRLQREWAAQVARPSASSTGSPGRLRGRPTVERVWRAFGAVNCECALDVATSVV